MELLNRSITKRKKFEWYEWWVPERSVISRIPHSEFWFCNCLNKRKKNIKDQLFILKKFKIL